ncbi:MAG: asparagine synthase (glutamine-hydrolyzing) [Bdellovibrionota bacterium]
MCGISGIIMGSGKAVSQDDLSLMSRAMTNRGPDADGFLLEGDIGFAQRRLKIIDLSDQANQPMFNENRKLGVVFNGEIYNFKELTVELKALGHRFKTRSDTEVIVHAFEQWGVDSFLRFNGMFAFALWDSRFEKPTVYLVRDRFGIKPLFCGSSSGNFVFASELKPIMALPWFKKEIDPQTLFYFLKFSHVPQPRSIFTLVSQLKPGTWMQISNGVQETHTYFDLISSWQVGLSESQSTQLTEDEAQRNFKIALSHSVRRQLVSDVPLGCFLSGGIDSSLLTMAATEILNETGAPPLKTFSIGYREAGYDETPFAREIASYFNTDHHEIIVEPKNLFDLITDIPQYFDQPFADPTLLPSILLSRFAKKHVTVALSGDGGDELFFGYSQQRALVGLRFLKHLHGGTRRAFFSGIGNLAEHIASFSKSRLFHQIAKMCDIMQFRNEAELFQYFVGTIGPLRMDRLASLISKDFLVEPSPFSDLVNKTKRFRFEDVITQIFLHTFLPDTVLAKTDRAGMACSLEARVPFLDDEMFAFASQLPFRFKSSLANSKLILRKCLSQELKQRGFSDRLAWRNKQGFSIPVAEWLRGDLKYLLDEYLSDYRLKREGVFNEKAIVKLVRAHGSGAANHSHLLWSLVSFQIWKENFHL